eukprot:Em0003g1669a
MSTTLVYQGTRLINKACLVQLLTNSQTLANLELRECGLDDGAIYSLAKGLEHSKLKKLGLGGNHFTTRGAIELDHVLQYHPTLTKEMYALCALEEKEAAEKVLELRVESIKDYPKEMEDYCTLALIHSKLEEVTKLKKTFIRRSFMAGYHLVVLLCLRDERVQRIKYVSDLFYHHDQTTEEHETVVQWIKSGRGDVRQQTSSIYADIVKGEVLPKMTVLVSSRPSANQNLHQLSHSQKCQYIEVIGFDKPSRYPWLGDASYEIISQLLVLAKLAYDGTKEDQLIFHGFSGALETLGVHGSLVCIITASCRQPWSLELWYNSINGECMKMLTVVEKGRAFDYIKSIDLGYNDKLGDQGAIILATGASWSGKQHLALQAQIHDLVSGLVVSGVQE